MGRGASPRRAAAGPTRPSACHCRGVRRAAASAETTASVTVPGGNASRTPSTDVAGPGASTGRTPRRPSAGSSGGGGEHDWLTPGQHRGVRLVGRDDGRRRRSRGARRATSAASRRPRGDPSVTSGRVASIAVGHPVRPRAHQRRLLPLVPPRPRGRVQRQPATRPTPAQRVALPPRQAITCVMPDADEPPRPGQEQRRTHLGGTGRGQEPYRSGAQPDARRRRRRVVPGRDWRRAAPARSGPGRRAATPTSAADVEPCTARDSDLAERSAGATSTRGQRRPACAGTGGLTAHHEARAARRPAATLEPRRAATTHPSRRAAPRPPPGPAVPRARRRARRHAR